MNKLAIAKYLNHKIDYTDEQKELIEAIEEAKQALEDAEAYFQVVSDPQLVDYAIYMDQAAKARFTYLLNKAKEQGITANNDFVYYEVDVV